jgi:hypothetical protein
MVDSANPDAVTKLSEVEPAGIEFGFGNGRQRDLVFLLDKFSVSYGSWFLAVYFSWEMTNLGYQPALVHALVGMKKFDTPWGAGDVNWTNRPTGYESWYWGTNIVSVSAGRGRDSYDDLASDPNSIGQGMGFSPAVSTTPLFTQAISAPPESVWVPYNGMVSGAAMPGAGIGLSASASYRDWVPPGWELGQPHEQDTEVDFKGTFLGYRFESEV